MPDIPQNEEPEAAVSVQAELDLMRSCVEALDQIEGEQLARVMRYLNDRFGSPEADKGAGDARP
jgi:hypothetical protein